MEYDNNPLVARLLSDAVYAAGGTAVVCGVGVLAYQGLIWWQTGEWPELTFGSFWIGQGGTYPFSGWPTLYSILLWLFRQPLGAVVVALGVLLLSAGERPAAPQTIRFQPSRGPGARGNRTAG